MGNNWFSWRKRPGHVDYRRKLQVDEDLANQALWGLVAVNVVVFMLWQLAWGTMLENVLVAHFLVSAESIFSLRLWTLVTSEFSHIDGMHLLFNMFALWMFGRDVVHNLGWKHFLHLYLAGAIAASLGHVLFQLLTGDPSPALGASGAVMAISVVYAAMFPDRTLLINFLIPVPVPIAVGFYILMDVMGLIGPGSGVAHAAHLGGALYGGLFWWWRTRR